MKRTNIIIFSVIVIVILLAGVGFYVAKDRGLILKNAGLVKDSSDTASDYTAVFLTNGQVYFGKLYRGDENTIDLKDIYYLQVDQQKQITGESSATDQAAANSNVVLVKLGEELHGPEDRMLINRQQVLFTESLKKDSKVVKGIQDYTTSKK